MGCSSWFSDSNANERDGDGVSCQSPAPRAEHGPRVAADWELAPAVAMTRVRGAQPGEE